MALQCTLPIFQAKTEKKPEVLLGMTKIGSICWDCSLPDEGKEMEEEKFLAGKYTPSLYDIVHDFQS